MKALLFPVTPGTPRPDLIQTIEQSLFDERGRDESNAFIAPLQDLSKAQQTALKDAGAFEAEAELIEFRYDRSETVPPDLASYHEDGYLCIRSWQRIAGLLYRIEAYYVKKAEDQ